MEPWPFSHGYERNAEVLFEIVPAFNGAMAL